MGVNQSIEKFQEKKNLEVGEISNELFFLWLFKPDIVDVDIDDILQKALKLNINKSIVINKIFLYLANKYSEDDIKNIISAYPELEEWYPSFKNNKDILKTKEMTPYVRTYIRSALTAKNYDTDKVKKHYHVGYPIPDSKLGRPKMEFKTCYYKGCRCEFAHGSGLKEHLEEKLPNFHNYFHVSHESHNLTPEKVLASGMTQCPSHLCDQKSRIFTPEELCDHFKSLGIAPFWYPDCILPEHTHLNMLQDKSKMILPFLNEVNECVVCCDNKACVMFLPCLHNLICLDCFEKSSASRSILNCPICKAQVNHKIFY
jgi:hypothetical protein